MNRLKRIFVFRWLHPEIEPVLILAWLLFFPDKRSPVYYFLSALFLSLSIFIHSIQRKNQENRKFSWALALVNILFISASLFSPYPWKSILFCGDFLLFSLYFMIWHGAEVDHHRIFKFLYYLLSISSGIVLIAWSLRLSQTSASVLFPNPILQAIASGLAFIWGIYFLVNKRNSFHLFILALNLGSLAVCASKAAFLGVIAASLYIGIKRKGILLLVIASIILVLLLPTPIRSRISPEAIKRDPYIFDRLKIWKMSLRILRENFWKGIGPDLFREQAPKYNFAQDKGFSRYGKVPESPHNVFLKIACEFGLPGILVILIFLGALSVRLTRAPPPSELLKITLAFLLFQGLLLNFLFNLFFLFFFLLCCRLLWNTPVTFHSVSGFNRWLECFFISILFLFIYISPFVSQTLLSKAAEARSIPEKSRLLSSARQWNPLDPDISLAQGTLLSSVFKQTYRLDIMSESIQQLRAARRLNPFLLEAYHEETALLQLFLEKKQAYPGLKEEMLAPLLDASLYYPFNPFLHMQMASIHWLFGDRDSAEREARIALKLEPDYISALYFLHENYEYIRDESEFNRHIQKILANITGKKFPPSSYLFRLYALPSGKTVSEKKD